MCLLRAEAVLIVHGINKAFEIFVATRDGKRLPSETPTKIYTESIVNMFPFGVRTSDPSLWHDAKEKRWVLVLGVVPLIVAVSQTSNPLDTFIHSFIVTPVAPVHNCNHGLSGHWMPP